MIRPPPWASQGGTHGSGELDGDDRLKSDLTAHHFVGEFIRRPDSRRPGWKMIHIDCPARSEKNRAVTAGGGGGAGASVM